MFALEQFFPTIYALKIVRLQSVVMFIDTPDNFGVQLYG